MRPMKPDSRPSLPAKALAIATTPWTWLHIALAGMFFTYIWRIQQLFPAINLVQPTVVASAMAIVLFFVKGDVGAVVRVGRHPIFVLILLMLFWMCLSVPTSVYQGYSFRFIYEDFAKTVLFCFLIAASIRSIKDVERLAIIHMIGAVIYCGTTLVRGAYEVDSGRLSGVAYYDANDLALLVLCVIPLALYFVFKRRALSWIVGLAVAALLLLIVVRTGSRGGFLGLLALGGYFLVGFRAVKRGVRIGVVAVAAVGVLVIAGNQYWERMSTIVEPEADYNRKAETGRVEIWKRGVGYMLRNPIVGVGAAAFSIAEGSSELAMARLKSNQGFKWSAAHNSFVQVGAELGVPGLAFFVLALWRGFNVGRWRRSNAPLPRNVALLGQALSGIVVAYAVSGFFLSAAYTAHIYAALALLIGYSRVAPGAAMPQVARVAHTRPGVAARLPIRQTAVLHRRSAT